MSALVKAQLLKHLSKFVKNLSADQLTLKLLQGTGDIENIELNEDLIGSTLGLPPWLRLTRVHCQRMSIRLYWTRLTSEPILIQLDVVDVNIEAVEPSSSKEEKPGKKEPSSGLNTLRMPYGFINKAVDGISLAINTIKVNFNAGNFFASLELSHVSLQSCLPNWSEDIKHLKHTRIKNSDVKQVLIFKLAKCNTMRLETGELFPNVTDRGGPKRKLTPFRVIVNKLSAKILFKRSLADSSVLFTKLAVDIDDILSVLTDAQAQVGVRFIDCLRKLSAGSSVEMAAKKVAVARNLAATLTNSSPSTDNRDARKADLQAYQKLHSYFIIHDISEHSTHVRFARIDLHLVAERASSSSNKDAVKFLDPILLEGAVRISLENLAFHLYPAHELRAECHDHNDEPRHQRLFRRKFSSQDFYFGCFEAIAFGSIDCFNLYVANLPHQKQPNMNCVAITGGNRWPAISFDSSQIVSEQDLSIVDSRNALRVTGVTVNFHLPTLLYMMVMVDDARNLLKIAENHDTDTKQTFITKTCTLVEVFNLELRYQPDFPCQPNENESGINSHSPLILLTIANITGQLIDRNIFNPFSDNSANSMRDDIQILSETELYSFLQSFLLPDQSTADEFERFCSNCCVNIEESRRIWQWQLNSVYARTITAFDGEIPLLYMPKVTGFVPHDAQGDKIHAMLQCDPAEGPVQVFAERAQFDNLQEMLRIFQNFASSYQKSVCIMNSLASHSLIDPCSFTSSQSTNVVFLARLISIRLLLPAITPLVVPLMKDEESQTGGMFKNSSFSGESCYTPAMDDVVSSFGDQISIRSFQKDAESLSVAFDQSVDTTGSDTDGNINFFQKLTSSSSKTTLTDQSVLYNTSDDGSNIIGSSSSSSIVDFVLVKSSDDPLVDDEGDRISPEVYVNPLDKSELNFGVQGGKQEVVSVQIVIEGATVRLESNKEPSDLEIRFDRINPVHKPKVLARRDVYNPLDLPVSSKGSCLVASKRRQFKIIISEVENSNKDSKDALQPGIDVWLAPDDPFPVVSMSAINALAHFLSPDTPVTENSGDPPIITVHSPANEIFTLKMDTPSVFDHCPEDLIHFAPPPPVEDKLMSITIMNCPIVLTQNDMSVTIAPDVNVDDMQQQMLELHSEVIRLREENARLKAQLDIP